MRTLSFLALAAVVGSASAQNFKGQVMDFAPMARLKFTQKAGVMEFTGRMIVRPQQQVAWKRMGLTELGAQVNREAATAKIADIAVGYIEPIDCYVVRVPASMDENTLAGQLMKTGLYEYVEPDYRVFATFTPNDPLLGVQWSQTNNNATEAWDICRGNSALTVGITDTGVHTSHEDLAANRVQGANSSNATTLGNVLTEAANGIGIVQPTGPHGTHCAGIAAAIGNNGKGVTGATIEGTKHLMVRISENGNNSTYTAITLGALWAASNGCRVVSTSFSGAQGSVIGTTGTTMKNTYNAVWCYAAGNDGGTYGASADWPDVTIVGAIASNNTLASFSARGQFLDLTAPGVGIRSTYWTNNATVNTYADLDGTSMATPYAAGVATMIAAENTAYSAQRIQDILYRSCITMNTPGTFGWGRVNLWNAMGRKANSYALVPGSLVGGVLADLYRQDGSSLTVAKGFVANSATPPIQVETVHNVPAYAGNNYGEIDIMTKASLVNATGSVGQRLLIKNQTTGLYETVAEGPVNGNVFEGQFAVNAGNWANYIVGGTVTVKVQAYQTGPVSNGNWQIAFDQVNVRTLRATE